MHIPGLKVVAPSHPHDARDYLIAAIRDNNPVVFIEHRLLYNQQGYATTPIEARPLNKGRCFVEGIDITIVAISHMVMEALRAQKVLAQLGIKAEIIDPVSLRPLDEELILNSYRKTGRLLIVDNGWLTCGASSEIMSLILENTLSKGKGAACPNVSRMGFADVTCPTTHSLEEHFYPDSKRICARAFEMCEKGPLPSSLSFSNTDTEIDSFKGPF